MHPSLEDLLALRDGESAAETAAHVAGCPACSAEIERLKGVTASLRAIPAERPPRDNWPRVRDAFVARTRWRRWTLVGGSALALAASLMLLVRLPGRDSRLLRGPGGDDVAALVSESQRLEGILSEMDPRGRVLDMDEAGTVADLEDRIAFIDARLDGPRGRRAPEDDVALLWRERVQLMKALVQVHDTRPVYVGL